MTIYATTPIPESAEICIEYVPGLIQKTRAERQKILRSTFGFDCRCPACSGDSPQSDSRREEVDTIVNTMGGGGMGRAEGLRLLGRLYDLLDSEGYVAMPEFTDPNVSSAFAVYSSMRRSGRLSGANEHRSGTASSP
jgi:hypothetical protein